MCGYCDSIHMTNKPIFVCLQSAVDKQMQISSKWQDKMVISTFSYVQKQCFEI